MHKLIELHQAIEARVGSIRASQPDWLCGKGCDNCCKRLADVPQLTASEWELLQQGLAALPAEQLNAIRERIIALGDNPPRPVTCPLLDQETGACPIYAQRPVACRTYGFYAQRDAGLYCQDIETRVAAGQLTDVIWGNHDAIDQQLGKLGEKRGLTAWFLGWVGAI